MDIKNLILIGGGLLIAAVVAHGLWIAWRARRDPLRLKIDQSLIAAVAVRDPVQTEFPNGGARVVHRWDEQLEQASLDLEGDTVRATPDRDPAPQERAPQERAPQERGASQERASRMPAMGTAPRTDASKTEPVFAPSQAARAVGETAIESSSGAGRPIVASRSRRADVAPAGEAEVVGDTTAEAAVRAAAAAEGGLRDDGAGAEGRDAAVRAGRESDVRAADAGGLEARSEIRVSEAGNGRGEGLRAGVARRAQEAFKAFGNRPVPKQPGNGGGRATGSGVSAGQSGAAESAPEDLILINVLAPREQPFTGSNLVEALRANGLKYGEMNIFHRIEPVTRTHQYSVANIIEPGTFDMAEVDEFRTPGVCFFMRLPGPEHPVEAFEDMHRVVRDVAQRLAGELKDERRSVLTGQTVEHYRHRVAEFCRRRMSMRA